ncbi:hypothetical protein WJX72_003866 [[Myrmecia] bisecta]|uniref:RNA helicase n=1 Tax=[Myrmecia] bisecta TaxID=41462 RepID=A0AAW1QQ76_9CHLO
MAARPRTADVSSEAHSFSELLLPDYLIAGLDAAGFHKPSPVQQAAIPMGRIGSDLVVQAKSGTGKTVVFGVICVENINLEVAMPQALVLAPTREIALQSAEVIHKLAAGLAGLSVGVFIGGIPVEEDQKLLRRACHIAVGTPGRICNLLEIGALKPNYLRMLVLDEADSLMSDSFRADVQWLHAVLPKRKQVMAFSATYDPQLLRQIEGMMRKPHRVMLCEETVSLVGVRQFYALVAGDGAARPADVLQAKADGLLKLFASVTFHQAVVFCNQKADAQRLADMLTAAGYPAAFISGSKSQLDRMDTISAVRGFKLRVIVSTDLVARGVDLERVNVVANLDLPPSGATYMHRVGRTGRFGTHGIAVTFVDAAELPTLHSYLRDIAGGQVEPLPDIIPEECYAYQLQSLEDQAAFQQLLQAPAWAASPASTLTTSFCPSLNR